MKDPYDVRSEECKPCGQERASQKEREERERETQSQSVVKEDANELILCCNITLS